MSTLGCVGYSAGAAYATYLAIVNDARALVSIGGVGAVDAAELGRPILDRLMREGKAGPDVALLQNEGDPDAGLEWVSGRLPRPLRVVTTVRGRGGHRFVDYARNGSVAAGFRFVLDRLWRSPASSRPG